MTKFPRKIKVGYRDYAITNIDGEKEGVIGQACHQERQIKIDITRSDLEKAEILLHEILHCIGVFTVTPEKELSERTVGMLSRGIISVWRDNPKAFRWIAEVIPKR